MRPALAAVRDHPLEALFTLAITTGMRQGEVLGLRWFDVDWATRRIFVRHILVRLHGPWWLGEPKTAKSAGSIELTGANLDLLREHRERQAERMVTPLSGDHLVFCDPAGEPLWGRHVTTREFQPLLRAAGLPPIRFHDLRHTFATLQLTASPNPKVVSEVLGHQEVAITLDRYSHALPTMQTEAMARLDAVLGRSSLDQPEVMPSGESLPQLRFGAAPAASRAQPPECATGADEGAYTRRRAASRPDPSSDRADEMSAGTAYRMRGKSASIVPT